MKRDIVIGNLHGETTEGRNDTDWGSRNDIIYDKPIDDSVWGKGSDELIGDIIAI